MTAPRSPRAAPDTEGDPVIPEQEPWDGSFGDHIQCPHCNAVDEERCDYPESLRHDGDTSETDCGVCEKPFRVTLCASYTYATEPLPAPEPTPRDLAVLREMAAAPPVEGRDFTTMPPRAPAPEQRLGDDARSLPDGTIVTCEHSEWPHPKGDDGRPCRFPKVVVAAPRAPVPETAPAATEPCRCGRLRDEHGGPYGEGACEAAGCEAFVAAAPETAPAREGGHVYYAFPPGTGERRCARCQKSEEDALPICPLPVPETAPRPEDADEVARVADALARAAADPGQRIELFPGVSVEAIPAPAPAASPACTGLTAKWCPVHGDCSCDEAEGLDGSACPLHAFGSDHGEAPAASPEPPRPWPWLDHAIACCDAWEPEARLIGNVPAKALGDMLRALRSPSRAETRDGATPGEIARAFHMAHETLAPSFRSRPASAVPWEWVPQANRDLMVATVRAVLFETGGPFFCHLAAAPSRAEPDPRAEANRLASELASAEAEIARLRALQSEAPGTRDVEVLACLRESIPEALPCDHHHDSRRVVLSRECTCGESRCGPDLTAALNLLAAPPRAETGREERDA